MEKILVVDDEESIRFVLSKGFERIGYATDTASTIEEAGDRLNEGRHFCVFLDIILPDGSGLDLIGSILKRRNPPSVVVMTAEATMKNAITAMQKGAFDYITKPFDFDVIDILINRIVEYRKMSSELARFKSGSPAQPEGEMVGRSAPMQELFKLIGRSANSDENILITGPTGSGKELVAKALHSNSSRKAGPFIAVNCAAIPNDLLESELFGHVKGAFTGAFDSKSGKFLAASGGVILLDEVGDMPLSLQAKMLRVLQDREFYPVGSTKPVKVDTRALASTNRNLAEDVASGRFREDLYHRLNVVHIKTPSLSERRSDIPLLAEHFLLKIAKTLNEKPKTVGPGVMDALVAYDWPGSVRELENIVRRAVVMTPGGTITLDDIPGELSGAKRAGAPGAPGGAGSSLGQLVKEVFDSSAHGQAHRKMVGLVERQLIEIALARTGGVQTKAAKLLGLNRNTLKKKMTELDIDSE
ncbi:Response regulator of zinc sigma-54-dependent two-component system [hydrothermal vent metagenome]|uniref:DNA-binding transcriptional regulator NtrC n=1 Tax=hydrothermal vent metagenome TaxID=652676 RepID=A0A3B1CWR9_9ZZZZ